MRPAKTLLVFALALALPATTGLCARLPAGAVRAKPQWWSWRSGGIVRTLDIGLIRGRIRIVRRPGPVEIEIARGPGEGRAALVSIELAERDGAVTVRDLYPPRIAADECLPPVDGRGDFWTSIVRFDAVRRAPRGVRVSARVMDGRVEGAD
jgi:hypothetical protein